VIFGVVASTSIHSTKAAMKERTWVAVQRLGLIALVLSTFHFAILKWRGWFVWENWHNGIPSGTLVVTTFVIIVFLFRGAARWKKMRGGQQE
jgi:DMSO/TMAO reductase YedYZ heme-binding membrane subunit